MGLKPFSLATTALALQNIIKNSPAGAKFAMEGIIKAMENDAKINGKYTDRTGNLRSSITGVVIDAGESNTLHHSGETVTIQNPGKDIVAVLYAGMEYGIYVELLDEFDVLGDTVKKWKRRIPQLLGEAIKDRGTYQRNFEKGNK